MEESMVNLPDEYKPGTTTGRVPLARYQLAAGSVGFKGRDGAGTMRRGFQSGRQEGYCVQNTTPATRITFAYGLHSPVRTMARARLLSCLNSSCDSWRASGKPSAATCAAMAGL